MPGETTREWSQEGPLRAATLVGAFTRGEEERRFGHPSYSHREAAQEAARLAAQGAAQEVAKEEVPEVQEGGHPTAQEEGLEVAREAQGVWRE